MQKHDEQGFTLIEISMVLVIMGLILGMVFKGKSVVDQAKIKSVQSQLHKIQLSVESFRQQQGHWPGDGCKDEGATQCDGTKNGILDQKVEQAAFWQVLIRYQLLNAQDRYQAFGQPWEVGGEDQAADGHQLITLLPISQACLLDRQMDDGVADTGALKVQNHAYSVHTQCASLKGDSLMMVNL